MTCKVRAQTGQSLSFERRLKNKLGHLGPKSVHWRGGITTENRRARRSLEYRLWRTAVFERDDYTCVFCGERGKYLEADHIKPFAYFRELRFDITNGRTLCAPCNKTTDTYNAKAKQYAVA